MGYLIEPTFIVKTVTIAESDFLTCGTIPFLLLKGKPNMVFQLFSIMAISNGVGYNSASNYTVIGSITTFEVAATHFDNFNSGGNVCIYNLGVNPSTDNSQKANNDLLITIRSGVDPVGNGDVIFTIVYRELYL